MHMERGRRDIYIERERHEFVACRCGGCEPVRILRLTGLEAFILSQRKMTKKLWHLGTNFLFSSCS